MRLQRFRSTALPVNHKRTRTIHTTDTRGLRYPNALSHVTNTHVDSVVGLRYHASHNTTPTTFINFVLARYITLAVCLRWFYTTVINNLSSQF